MFCVHLHVFRFTYVSLCAHLSLYISKTPCKQGHLAAVPSSKHFGGPGRDRVSIQPCCGQPLKVYSILKLVGSKHYRVTLAFRAFSIKGQRFLHHTRHVTLCCALQCQHFLMASNTPSHCTCNAVYHNAWLLITMVAYCCAARFKEKSWYNLEAVVAH